MSPKTLIYTGMIVGSYGGSLLPLLWGAGYFSFSSIIFSIIGGICGIWLGFRMSR
ncbi:MAG: hypothetical protein AAB610_02190 [Patescibacteria group bacterium]